MGEAGHVIDGAAQSFDRSIVVDGRETDRAVDDDYAPRIAQQGGEVLVVNVENPLRNA